jgi:hypothetical protein
LSTDCSIVLDVGEFVRAGFAPMDEIKLTAELLAEGWSSAELDRKARSGEVQRIRRGAYDCLPAKSFDRRDQHRRLIAATVRQTFVDTAVSHMSAAVLHSSRSGTTSSDGSTSPAISPVAARSVAMSISMWPRWQISMFARSKVNGLPHSRALCSICCGRCQWSGQRPSAIQHSDRV